MDMSSLAETVVRRRVVLILQHGSTMSGHVHANSDLGIAVLFGVDVLACPRCGQAMRLIALIDPTDVVQRILHHLGLPIEVPEPAPARAPPSLLETDAIDGCAAELAFDPPG
jgi:hypothetical protein